MSRPTPAAGPSKRARTLIPSELITAIRQSHQILCISHVNPDGDAVGSLLGMGWLLQKLGKQPTLTLQDALPEEHRVLPGTSEIITAQSGEFAAQVRGRSFELIICLDASSPDRMGTAYHPASHAAAPLAVIDHHVTNTRFGAINWVAPECAATSQMLVYLADALDVPLEGALAECLLTGIVTDTLGFRTSNTTPDVLEAAMRLMHGGADLAVITERTLNRRPFSLIELWGKVLPRVRLEAGVIWAAITNEDFASTGYVHNDVGLSSYLVTADEADLSVVFTEAANEAGAPAVECSFRSKPGFDVSRIAFTLGGGGHPAASGCTLPGKLAEVEAHVVTLLKQARREQLAQGLTVADGRA